MPRCKHETFTAKVNVSRIVDKGLFSADVTIHCSQCGLPFQFLGLSPGWAAGGAAVSVDGTEARLAIAPKGSRPSPLHQMGGARWTFDG